jgi:hypothetical protein
MGFSERLPNSAIACISSIDGYYLMFNPSEYGRGHLVITFCAWDEDVDHLVAKISHGTKEVSYPNMIPYYDKHLLVTYSVAQREIRVERIELDPSP